MRSYACKIGAIAVAAGLLLASTGCNKKLTLNNGFYFVSGLLIGNVFTPTSTEQTCYENGVLVDCADLPEDLGS